MILQMLLFMSLLMTSDLNEASEHRKLFIFADEENAANVEQQLFLLNKEQEGIKERDLEIIVVGKDNTIFKKYHVPQNAFTVILVGKDGSEKYRTQKVLQPEKLFALIDAMPMRRAEMRKRN